MSDKRRRVHMFGMLLLALCLALASSGRARANWMVEGFESVTTQSLEVAAATELFKLLVPKPNLEISCKKIANEGAGIAKIFALSSEGTATIEFSSCKMLVSGIEQPGCKPVEPIVVGVKATLLLHNNLTYVLFSPTLETKSGIKIFAKIQTAEPELCVPFETANVRGTIVAECLNQVLGIGAKLCEAETVKHYLQQAPAALFTEDPLRLGTAPASLDGIGRVELFSGKQWSGII